MSDGLAVLVNSFLRGRVLSQRVYIALSVRCLVSSIIRAGTFAQLVLQQVDFIVEFVPDLNKIILGFLALEFPLFVGFSESLRYLVQPFLPLGLRARGLS